MSSFHTHIPFVEHLGFELLKFEDGEAEIGVTLREELCNSWSVAHGGVSCEDPPGYRDGPSGRLYLAYVRDPDGNKLCVLHRPPTPAAVQ